MEMKRRQKNRFHNYGEMSRSPSQSVCAPLKMLIQRPEDLIPTEKTSTALFNNSSDPLKYESKTWPLMKRLSRPAALGLKYADELFGDVLQLKLDIMTRSELFSVNCHEICIRYWFSVLHCQVISFSFVAPLVSG